jgi:hypothetical protein
VIVEVQASVLEWDVAFRELAALKGIHVPQTLIVYLSSLV